MRTTTKYRKPTKADAGRTLTFVRIANETGNPCEEIIGDGTYLGHADGSRPGNYRTSLGCFNTRYVLVVA